MSYNIGDIVTGTISGIKPYGVFIKFEDTFGFCHISNCSHKFIKNLNDWFPIGSEIKAKVMDMDLQHNRINVSIKDCENQKIEVSREPANKKLNLKKSNVETKKQYSREMNQNTNNKLSFDDMLKTYLKNSEERLDSISKRNQKYGKR